MIGEGLGPAGLSGSMREAIFQYSETIFPTSGP